MSKFKIERRLELIDGEIKNNEIYIHLTNSSLCDYSLNMIINTEDLPDLIKVLQDKQKEIEK